MVKILVESLGGYFVATATDEYGALAVGRGSTRDAAVEQAKRRALDYLGGEPSFEVDDLDAGGG